jgi:YhcH/YjgK/YiaL family protein
MIAGDLVHVEDQMAVTPCLRKALSFLRWTNLQDLPEGKIEIEGERIYALVQCYDTAATDRPKFEFHRKFIDVQYIVSGEEIIGWASVERMAITEAYDEVKDVALGTVPSSEVTPVHLSAGQLVVLYPEDAHAPKLAAGKPSRVNKVVVKVAV